MRACVLTSCLLISALAGDVRAQQTAAAQMPGGVTGHVYCADTNRPARSARVTVEPIDDLRAVAVDGKGNILSHSIPTAILAATEADGSYSIDNLAPGQYYIVAEMPGYLTPLAEFSDEEMRLPNEQTGKRMRDALQRVVVLSGQRSHMDFRLERGGAIEGTVRYDDGGAVAGAPIVLFYKNDPKDPWRPFHDVAGKRFQNPSFTDDRGHYRIAMMPPAEYLVAVELQHATLNTNGLAMPGLTVSRASTAEAEQIYFGDTARKDEATAVLLHKGEERSDINIVVDLSKLYKVSGTVIAERDGHAINGGQVLLVDSQDGSTMRYSSLLQRAGNFTLYLVPAGEYILKIAGAADLVAESGQPEDVKGTHSRMLPVHVYADAQQPLNVSGDLSGLTVKLAEPQRNP